MPIIASSGAGKIEHFTEVFKKNDVEAALAAGIFHREEVPIEAVKKHAGAGYRNPLATQIVIYSDQGTRFVFPQRSAFFILQRHKLSIVVNYIKSFFKQALYIK